MFSDRLKEIRNDLNMNMKQMAEKLAIPYTTYVGYEKGEREPSFAMLGNLAVLFGVSADYLLGVSDTKSFVKNQSAFCNSEIQQSYEKLDKHGRQIVDTVLAIESERCAAENEEQIQIRHSFYKVSAGLGYDLDDSESWEMISVPDTPEAERADFALTIQGDSMEPVYFDGDIVLVKQQDQINQGEVGIFIVNGEGYIKKLGRNRLISLNAVYEDIVFNENDHICCAGKVIGRV